MMEIRLSPEVYERLSRLPLDGEELWGIVRKNEVVVLGEVRGPVDLTRIFQFPAVDFVFHTHPRGGAIPSPTDIGTAKELPIVWAVVGRELGVRVIAFYSVRPFVIVDERRVPSREECGIFIVRRPVSMLRFLHPSPITKLAIYLWIRFLRRILTKVM
ncbi:MAG: hypothetical protein QXJ48_02305 [Candidatus Korarchaeum sp.]